MTDHASTTLAAGQATSPTNAARRTDATLAAAFDSQLAARAALNALVRGDVDVQRLSIVAKDYRRAERPVRFYDTGEHVKVWGSRGAFWSAPIGMLVGPAFFLMPSVGHVVVVGSLASTLVAALEGARVGGGASVLGAALADIGIPGDAALRYESDVEADRCVVLVHDADGRTGSAAERLLRDADARCVDRF